MKTLVKNRCLKHRAGRGKGGFTLIELLIVIAIIGILAAIAIPQFNIYKSRAYDSDSKSNLHNLYLACKSYWGENGAGKNCQVSIVVVTTYGFIQSADVSISGSGIDYSFHATAQHSSSSNSYSIDETGSIAQLP